MGAKKKAAVKKAPERVTVYAKTRLVEAGDLYEPGDEFETTKERAESLGGVVTMNKPE
tara:strand:- start:748 stop:921 length:174 start_codon:yes stop_codon:yes gene_type:complete